MSENNQETDRTQLFLQALQERMAQMVVEYEGKVAELRVEYTLASQSIEQLSKRIEELEGTSAVQEAGTEAK